MCLQQQNELIFRRDDSLWKYQAKRNCTNRSLVDYYILSLCIGFIDYEKAFDTVEHFAIFEALRKTNEKKNETYINILQNIYNQATARVHLDKLMSTEFQIHRGVRQGDPLSPKLFTAVMEEVFKKAEISEGVNVDGENLSNLRFADDVALLSETTKQMEKHLKI